MDTIEDEDKVTDQVDVRYSKISVSSKLNWQKPEYREKVIAGMKKHSDRVFAKKLKEKLNDGACFWCGGSVHLKSECPFKNSRVEIRRELKRLNNQVYMLQARLKEYRNYFGDLPDIKIEVKKDVPEMEPGPDFIFSEVI